MGSNQIYIPFWLNLYIYNNENHTPDMNDLHSILVKSILSTATAISSIVINLHSILVKSIRVSEKMQTVRL